MPEIGNEMIEVPDYVKDELGTDTLPEFEEAEEVTRDTLVMTDDEGEVEKAEVEADAETEVEAEVEAPPVEEAETLPMVIESPQVEIVRAGQLAVNVEGEAYLAEEGRLYKLTKFGDKSTQLLVSSLIVVVANARDTGSSGWGKVVRFEDGDGVQKQLYIRTQDIISNGYAVVRELANEGLVVSGQKGMMDALLHYLNLAPPMDPRKATCTDRIGWHDNVYLFQDNTVIGHSDTRYVYTGALISSNHSVKGSWQDWKDNVGSLCRGNSLLILAVCVAFASALLRLLKIESGGFHVFGESSTGKSTTLYVAASVFGEPEPLLGTWRTTANGTEGRAKKFNDALMILDELHQSTPKEAGEAAYMIMNGKGKQRANVLGEARDVTAWRLNCLSSGEIAYASFIREGGTKSRAGQEVRMLDISADMGLGMGAFEDIHEAKDSHTFAEQLKKASTGCYGAPIRQFITRLIANVRQLEPAFAEIKEQFFDEFVPAGADGQVQRVASKFAVAVLAGDMATSMGLTGWEPEEAYDAVGSCFTRWLTSWGTTGPQEAEKAVEQVQNFLLRHGMSRFAPVTELGYNLINPERQTTNMAGFRVVKSDKTYEFIVFPEAYPPRHHTG
jgi:putative DNA primase/helicase